MTTTSDATIYDIIMRDQDSDGRWHHFEPTLVLEHILDNIHVDILLYQARGGDLEPLVCIYMESPTLDAMDWNVFRACIMSLMFGNDLASHPTPFHSTLWCAICHNHDHPTGLCPLPSTPSWNGPNHDYPTLRGA